MSNLPPVAQHPGDAENPNMWISSDPIQDAMGYDLYAIVNRMHRVDLIKVCEVYKIPYGNTMTKNQILPAIHAKIADGTIVRGGPQGSRATQAGQPAQPLLPDSGDPVADEHAYRDQLAGFRTFALRSLLTKRGGPFHHGLNKDEIIDMLVDMEMHDTIPELPARLREESKEA